MRRLLLLVVLLSLAAGPGCRKRRAPVVEEELPDARPAEILTPGGTVSPEKVKREVEDTLQKEHERTLEPRVE